MASQLPLCNICGKSFQPSEDSLSDHRRCGYNSPHDGDSRNLDICYECYEKELQSIQERSVHDVWVVDDGRRGDFRYGD